MKASKKWQLQLTSEIENERSSTVLALIWRELREKMIGDGTQARREGVDIGGKRSERVVVVVGSKEGSGYGNQTLRRSGHRNRNRRRRNDQSDLSSSSSSCIRFSKSIRFEIRIFFVCTRSGSDIPRFGIEWESRGTVTVS